MSSIKVSDTSNSAHRFNFVERITFYNDLLLDHGYTRNDVLEIVTQEDIANEQSQISKESPLFLLSLKKILLYAKPVVAPYNSKGVQTITASFPLDAIEYDPKKRSTRTIRFATNDKLNLLGFYFDSRLINNLSIDVYPHKFIPVPTHNVFESISLEHLSGVTKTDTVGAGGVRQSIYLIDRSASENAVLYNNILKILYISLRRYKTDSTLDTCGVLEKEYKFDASRIYAEITTEWNKDKASLDTNNRIRTVVNAVIDRHMNFRFLCSMISSLLQTGNEYLYGLITVYGIGSPQVSKQIDALKYIKEQTAIMASNQSIRSLQALNETKAEKIARELFPYLFSETDKRGVFIRFNRFSISKLGKKYKDTVLLQLEKDIAYQTALVDNRCDHIPLVRKLNAAFDTDKGSVLLELKPLINKDADQSDHFIKCKKCGYDLMCEHEFHLYSMLADVQSNSDSGVDEFYRVYQSIINQYKRLNKTSIDLDHKDTLFTYNCKYCSKELGKSDDIIQASANPLGRNYEDDQYTLKSIIVNCTSDMLRKNLNMMEIGLPQKAVIGSVLDMVLSPVEELVSSINKNKILTNKDDVVKFNIYVYVLVAIVHLSANIVKVSGNKPVIVGGDAPANQTTFIKSEFKNAYNVLKSLPLYKESGMNDFKLKSAIISYYRDVSKGYGMDINDLQASEPRDVILEITSGSIYQYVRDSIKYLSKNKNPSYDDVMGMTKAETLELLGIGKKTKKEKGPTSASHSTSNVNIYTNIPKLSAKDSKNKHHVYASKAYDQFREYISSGTDRSSQVSPSIPDLVSYEETQDIDAVLSKTRPSMFVPVENTRESDYNLSVLNKIYCDSGIRHKWSYVFMDKKQKSELVVSKKNIKTMIDLDAYRSGDLTYVDKMCDVCETRLSSVDKSTNESINSNVEDLNTKAAFFEYYTSNCPIKDNHMFESVKDTLTCSQCGATKKELIDHDSAFYKKYQSKYRSSKSIRDKELQTKLTKLSTLTTEKENDSMPIKKLDYSIMDSKINEAMSVITKQFSISDSAIYSLGATDGIDYRVALSESKSKMFEVSESRLYNLYSYNKLLVDLYVYVKNCSISDKHYDSTIREFIKDTVFEKSKKAAVEFKSLPYNLNDIWYLVNQHGMMDGNKKTNKPITSDTIKALIFILVSNLRSILNLNNPLFTEMSRIILNKIIYQDQVKSKCDIGSLKSRNAYNVEEFELNQITVVDEDNEEEGDVFSYGLDIDSDLMGEGDDVEDMDAKID